MCPVVTETGRTLAMKPDVVAAIFRRNMLRLIADANQRRAEQYREDRPRAAAPKARRAGCVVDPRSV
jgi:hypothetical protein